jgi:ion channel-forming bestrophin family protein
VIVYDRGGWLSMVLRVHGSSLPLIWPRILATTTTAAIFTYLQRYPAFHHSLTMAPFLITALPLGIILGFRNSSSYERFWEGRKLWGALVNASRSLLRQLDAFVVARAPEDEAEAAALRRRATLRVIAFAYALRMHLRGETDRSELAPLLDADEIAGLSGEPSPPAAVLHRLGAELREARERKWLRSRHAHVLEASVVTLTDVLGGCERIKGTPTPVSYLIFVHRAVAFYCFLLPFGVADSVHALTPVVVFFVSYALFSLDAIGEELDDPFRASQGTLPIASISRAIEIYARRRLGDETPEPLGPVGGVLS